MSNHDKQQNEKGREQGRDRDNRGAQAGQIPGNRTDKSPTQDPRRETGSPTPTKDPRHESGTHGIRK